MNQNEYNDSSNDSEDALDISFENTEFYSTEAVNTNTNILTEEKYRNKLEIIKEMKKNISTKDE